MNLELSPLVFALHSLLFGLVSFVFLFLMVKQHKKTACTNKFLRSLCLKGIGYLIFLRILIIALIFIYSFLFPFSPITYPPGPSLLLIVVSAFAQFMYIDMLCVLNLMSSYMEVKSMNPFIMCSAVTLVISLVSVFYITIATFIANLIFIHFKAHRVLE